MGAKYFPWGDRPPSFNYDKEKWAGKKRLDGPAIRRRLITAFDRVLDRRYCARRQFASKFQKVIESAHINVNPTAQETLPFARSARLVERRSQRIFLVDCRVQRLEF